MRYKHLLENAKIYNVRKTQLTAGILSKDVLPTVHANLMKILCSGKIVVLVADLKSCIISNVCRGSLEKMDFCFLRENIIQRFG